LLENAPGSPNGVYLIDPDGAGPVAPVNLYCDMTAGGWTLVANIYDSAGDDAPNTTNFVVSGWQQTGSGSWANAASTVGRNASGTGSAAVSLAFVAALKANAGQRLKMCFARQNGTETECRSSADGTMGLVSEGSGNPKLTLYAGGPLTYTFGRLAGLAGSMDGYAGPFLAPGYCIPRIPGNVGDFGNDPNHPVCERTDLSVNASYNGVWHCGGWGMSYNPQFTDGSELKGGTAIGAVASPNPNLNTYGFRLYVQ